MDRMGRIAVILVSLLLAGLASQVCHGQLAAPPHSIPPPRPGSDFGKSERRDAEPTATDVRSPILLFPELEDRLLAAARASTEHWLRVKLVTSAQLPGQSSSPTSTPVGAPLPPALDLRQSSEPTATSSGDEPPVDLAFAHLKRAPLEPTDFRFPINLATALRLSDARPLIVAAAQASVWVAEAQLTRAKVLWVPTLNVGRRLYPPRRRRPGLQQGHPDRAERELFLRRWRPGCVQLGSFSVREPDRCLLRAAGRAAGPRFRGNATSRPPRTTPCS